jgi:hypothetical protein
MCENVVGGKGRRSGKSLDGDSIGVSVSIKGILGISCLIWRSSSRGKSRGHFSASRADKTS